MFSDRFWFLKLSLAIGLLAWLGHRARRELSEVDPDYRKIPVYFPQLEGKTITLWAKTVTAAGPGGFDIDTDVGQFHVLSPERPPIGERVSMLARPAAPRTLEAITIQRNEGVSWKRPLNYLVSIAAVAVFLLWARGMFRWPVHGGVFHGRY